MNSWFEGAAEEQNIELIWSNPLRNVCFITTGITPSEFMIWLEMEMRAWETVKREKKMTNVNLCNMITCMSNL